MIFPQIVHQPFYKISSKRALPNDLFVVFNPSINKYSENANASQVVYDDDSYRTSFYFVYPPQDKVLGDFRSLSLF